MKRVLAALTIGSLFLIPIADAGARQKRIEGHFVAEALPLPQDPLRSETCGLGREGINVDGVNRVVEPFQAPFSGWLTVEAVFSGDWDVALLDEDGGGFAWGVQLVPNREGVTYFLRKGQKIGIAVCNAQSTSNAEVRYVLEGLRPWDAPAGRELQRLTTELRYDAPSVATKDVFVICDWSSNIGCPASVDVRPTDRFITVDVSDASAGEVSAQVYQSIERDGYRTYTPVDGFCTTTDEPIAVKPGVARVGVLILMGSCEDGTFGTATSGTISLTLSNRNR